MTKSASKMTVRATLLALGGVLAAQAAVAQTYTVKLGYGRIDPRATSSDLEGTLPTGDTLVPLAAVPAGNNLEVQPKSTVLFSIERSLNDNWSVELALGIPPTHDVKLNVSDEIKAAAKTAAAVKSSPLGADAFTNPAKASAAAGAVGGYANYVKLKVADHVAAYDGVAVSRVKQTAPTIFLNYKFFDATSKFRPYVGVGFNYTKFTAKTTAAGDALYNDGQVKIHLTNSIGLAFQTGVTYQIDKTWSVNAGWATAAVKNNMTITTATSKQEASYRFHPSLFSATVGYTF
jgi:outer membrane protein